MLLREISLPVLCLKRTKFFVLYPVGYFTFRLMKHFCLYQILTIKFWIFWFYKSIVKSSSYVVFGKSTVLWTYLVKLTVRESAYLVLVFTIVVTGYYCSRILFKADSPFECFGQNLCLDNLKNWAVWYFINHCKLFWKELFVFGVICPRCLISQSTSAFLSGSRTLFKLKPLQLITYLTYHVRTPYTVVML